MMMVNIYEAKTRLSQLVNEALKGEEVVIARGGVPLLKLTPYTEELLPRRGGQLKGLLKVSDEFDKPLPDSVMKQFYEGGDE